MGVFLILLFSNTTVLTKAIHCELEMGTKNQGLCSEEGLISFIFQFLISFVFKTDAMEQFTACMMQVVNCELCGWVNGDFSFTLVKITRGMLLDSNLFFHSNSWARSVISHDIIFSFAFEK